MPEVTLPTFGIYELLVAAGLITTGAALSNPQGQQATRKALGDLADKLDDIKKAANDKKKQPPAPEPIPIPLPCSPVDTEPKKEPKRDSIERDKQRGFDHDRGTFQGKPQDFQVFKEQDGVVVAWNGSPVTNRKLIYVKLPDGTFRFAPRPDPADLGRRRGVTLPHSMLGKGKSVIGAGECETDENGRVVSIDNRSGHYQPDKDNLKATKRNMERAGLASCATQWQQLNQTDQQLKPLEP